ncbi:HAD family hydrolase [Peptococcus simiae]|uniref:HAD family hydrolase n=1 Tax=Peptococcus simiae TaxID=1643805 RepID=UPI0039810B8C
MTYAIFDMDGTLIDSMPLWQDVGTTFRQKRKLPPLGDLTQLFHKMTIVQAAAYLKEAYQLPESMEAVHDDIRAIAWQAYAEQVPLKAGVLDALAAFRQADIPMGIATANERPLVNLVLDRLGLSPYIQAVHTCSEVGATKKEGPDVYQACLQDLGGESPQDCYVFEDAPHAAESAASAGFQVVGVYDQAYAYDLPRLKKASQHYFETASQWPSLLK